MLLGRPFSSALAGVSMGTNTAPYTATCLIVCCFASVVGCGASGPPRLPVSGKVTAASGEAFNGSISFTPAPEGLGATAAVSEGAYRFDRSNGPTAGSYEVTIRRTASKPLGTPVGKTRTEWTRKADVPANGPFEIDFQLD